MSIKPELSSNWASVSPEMLRRVLILGREKMNLIEEISTDTCLYLEKDTSSEGCFRITMQYPDRVPLAINSVTLLSEARNVEVFGAHGEYINTTKGDLVDDFDGTAVYEIYTELQVASKTVSIQFCSCPDPDKFWLYGLHITTFPTAEVSQRTLPSAPTTLNNPNMGQVILANTLLEEQLKASEERIMKRLDDIEKRMNEKLDAVLCSLALAKLDVK